MNIVQLQDHLKNFSQDQLVREMQTPSGSTPQFLVLGEIMRRMRMKDDFTAQNAKGDQGTVAQEAIAAAGVPQGGIADMARAMAPSTDMTQNTGVQAMYAGGPVKKMAKGDIVVRDGKRYIEQEDGTYLSEDGVPATLNSTSDDRTFGQRYIGDPLRSIFQPVGDTMRETMQPVGQDLRSLFEPRPVDPVTVPPEVSLPAPLTYDEIVARARVGAMPTLEQLRSSVESGLLNGQQAADVQAMTEGTGYTPSAEEMRVAEMPGLSPVGPPAPAADTPYERAKQGLGDFVAGAFGGRTIGEQAAIAAERSAAIAAAAAPEVQEVPKLQPLPTTTAVPGAAAPQGLLAAQSTALLGAQPAAAPQGGAQTAAASQGGTSGGAGGVSSYEQALMDTLSKREKAAEQDKWLALAQVGLNLMSSRQPTLGGALGEAGLKGIEAARSARDQYDKEKLELTGAIAQSRAARAKAASGGGSGGGGIKPLSASGIMTQQKNMLDLAESDLSVLTGGQNPKMVATMLKKAVENGDLDARGQLIELNRAMKQYDSAYSNYMSAAGQLGALITTESGGAEEVPNFADE